MNTGITVVAWSDGRRRHVPGARSERSVPHGCIDGSPRMPTSDHDWSKPAAKAIPKEGYFELERGRYGPVYPRTPACYGFSIIAKVKEGREAAVRA